MAHTLVYYGNTMLESIAERVENIDNNIISIINEMSDIMIHKKSMGLAAPQINIGKRIIIADTGQNKDKRVVLINPEIKEFSITVESINEGCLSMPDIFIDVIRPAEIYVKGVTPDGKETGFTAAGLVARVIQHEIDHLNGIFLLTGLKKISGTGSRLN